jgi:hypothetical protein
MQTCGNAREHTRALSAADAYGAFAADEWRLCARGRRLPGMPSVYVSSDELPITIACLDKDLAKVVEVVENWCDVQSSPMTFKTATERYVLNFRRLSAVKISERLDPAASTKPVVQFELGPNY